MKMLKIHLSSVNTFLRPRLFIGLILISAFIFSRDLALAQTDSRVIYKYKVTGVIVQLPDSNRPKSKLLIRHDPIKDYVDETGSVVGMGAMTMPFTLAENVKLSGFVVGDSVEFLFESWWKPKPGDAIVEINKKAD